MKKVTDPDGFSVSQLLGLGQQSARKSYYPELTARMAELEAERNRYKWLFENALHGIFQAVLDGPLLTANPALAAMLGDATVEVTLARCGSLAALFAEPEEAEGVAALLRRHGHLQGHTTWLAGSDGRRVPVALTLLRKPNQERRSWSRASSPISPSASGRARSCWRSTPGSRRGCASAPSASNSSIPTWPAKWPSGG